MRLAVTGWGVLSSAGIGIDTLARALAEEAHPGREAQALYDDALPASRAHVLVELNVREMLGRKGTSSIDRRTAIALIACRDALADGGVQVDDASRHRIGITLGTRWGSLKAMSDYTKESLLEERPYLVEPARFPNTVMNCASGQAAIRYGLKGVNATIAGAEDAFLGVLEYASNALRCGYVDTMVAGAVEELTPHTAWASHLMNGNGSTIPAGEAAAVFVLEDAAGAHAAERRIDAEVLAVATGFAPGGRSGDHVPTALVSCVRRALKQAGVEPSQVSLASTSEAGHPEHDRFDAEAMASVFGDRIPRRIAPKRRFGDCHAANGALQLAALLALHRSEPTWDGRLSLITAWSDDGGVGAAVVKGWSRDGAHRG